MINTGFGLATKPTGGFVIDRHRLSSSDGRRRAGQDIARRLGAAVAIADAA